MARKKLYEEGESGEIPDSLADTIISDLKTNLGDVAYVLGKGDAPPEVKEWLSTGSIVLDSLISNRPDVDGGIPLGRLTEISGESGTGKSLLSYMILKDCKDRGGIPVLIDTENAADMSFLRMLGLDPDDGKLVYVQPDSIEEVFTVMERVITKIREEDKNRLCTIVWDSVAATSTGAELQGEYGDATVALGPRLLGQGLRKITRFIGKQRIAVVFLNQLRMKIGMAFGDPYVTPGGMAIPFFSSVRLRLFTAGKVKAGTDVIGVGIKAKVAKNRMGPPLRECILHMYFDKGVIDEESWLDYLVNFKIVNKINTQRSSIDFDGNIIEFRNRDFVETIKSNPELKEFCKRKIKEGLYIEQDPNKRTEEIELEEISDDEDI